MVDAKDFVARLCHRAVAEIAGEALKCLDGQPTGCYGRARGWFRISTVGGDTRWSTTRSPTCKKAATSRRRGRRIRRPSPRAAMPRGCRKRSQRNSPSTPPTKARIFADRAFVEHGPKRLKGSDSLKEPNRSGGVNSSHERNRIQPEDD